MKTPSALKLRTQPELRAEILQKRKTADAASRSQASLQISSLLNQMIDKKKPRYVGSFVSILGEPSLELELPREQICYPRIIQDELEFFYSDQSSTQFQKGRFEVPEPPHDLERKVELGEEDVVLVPGVVFNLKGHRIGMGKGFYDRYLSRSKAKAWGVGFGFQVVEEEWSLQPWDRPVDVLVTEGFAIELNH